LIATSSVTKRDERTSAQLRRALVEKVHRIGAALECVNEFYDFQVFAANRKAPQFAAV
jgi:hypothetical protein